MSVEIISAARPSRGSMCRMLKVGTLFSGIGAPEKALKMLGIPYELVYFCEKDEFAVKSYCAIHKEPESKNLGDITKVDIDKLPKGLDLIVGGSPCQDFSIAGKREGGEIDSGTRSSLMWNFVEIIKETQPKAVLWENVKGALSEKDYPNYQKFIGVLIAEGYKISAFTLNSKYFGIPQNRERIFVLGSKTHTISAPIGYDCGIRLRNVKEEKVDEKYYLSEQMIKGFLKHNENHEAKGTGFLFKPKTENDIACCLRANAALAPTDNVIIQRPHGYNQGSILTDCPAITSSSWENNNCLIEITQNQSQGYRVYDSNGLSVTLSGAKTGLYTDLVGSMHNYDQRIRRLTPLECFRLMGFNDEDFVACKKAGLSDTQLYKQAGNSIVVNVLMAIFGDYYGIQWQKKVYGKWHKSGQELFADLPICN